jgi:protein TonB
MAHSIRSHERPHLEPNRIAGLAATIAVNVAFLMLLLVPLRTPSLPPLPTPGTVIQWIIPKPVKPVEPVRVPITKSHPATRPVAVQQPAAIPHQDPPVIRDSALATQPDNEPDVQPSADTDTGYANRDPQVGMSLQYDMAPAPAYPRDALREGVQGTVLLQVLVDVDGRPLRVEVQHSSGDRRLDVAARRQVLDHWRFRPAMRNGHAVQAIGLVPVAFNLGG